MKTLSKVCDNCGVTNYFNKGDCKRRLARKKGDIFQVQENRERKNRFSIKLQPCYIKYKILKNLYVWTIPDCPVCGCGQIPYIPDYQISVNDRKEISMEWMKNDN